MAIPLPVAELMLREACRRPIGGRGLFFGRSTVLIEPDELSALFHLLGLRPASNTVEIDTVTKAARDYPDKKFVTDSTFYRWLGVERIDVADVSDYEGANIVHNICDPLPSNLVGQYDFIFNSSVLDNVFDPAAALRHMTAALKPGGRIFHIEMGSPDCFPYLIFTPGWFQDYYAINDFERCQVYVGQIESIEQLLFGPWVMWGGLPMTGQRMSAPPFSGIKAVVLAIAERGAASTVNRSPIQGPYRSARDQQQIDPGMERFLRTSMPYHIAHGTAPGVGEVYDMTLWKWVYCGKYGLRA